MKILTVSLLVCAMMVLTAAAAVPEAENNETVMLFDQDEENQLVKTSTCPNGWTEYKDRCFTYVSTLSTWAEAEKDCLDRGGHLASVHSFQEQAQIQNMIFRDTGLFPLTWLGGNDAAQEGFWFWSDGTNFDFTYWDVGQPDNHENGDCLAMNFGDNKRYDDQLCSNNRPSVCAITK